MTKEEEIILTDLRLIRDTVDEIGTTYWEEGKLDKHDVDTLEEVVGRLNILGNCLKTYFNNHSKERG